MAIVMWLHFSDLHLNSEGVETERLRDALPKYLAKNVQQCNYVFCTGDIRQAPANFAEKSSEYIKSLCAAVQVSIENFFIVPGNHDVNRSLPERVSAIKEMCKVYRSRDGQIESGALESIHKGQEDFRKVLASIYAGIPERVAYYESPQMPHFVVQTEHFNILHVDTTVSYTEKRESNLILGTWPLSRAIKTLDKAKPTILLTHYAIGSLSQDEKSEVSNLLRDHNITLWLAGHEHTHQLMPFGYLTSIQAGELKFEEGAHATVLVGEYDTDTGKGAIEAHTWFQEGWAKYPRLWRGYSDEYAELDKFPFVLGFREPA